MNRRGPDAEPRFRQAQALHQAGQPAAALAIYAGLCAAYPDHARLLSLTALAALQCGRNADSAAYGRRAVAADAGQAPAWFYLGVALRRMQDAAGALDCYRRALALNPGHADAWCNLGNLLAELRQRQEALTCLQQAVALAPGHVLAQFNLGNVLRELRRYADAETAYRLALAGKPDFADAWCNLGTTYKDWQRHADAVACYDRALALRPDFAFLPGQRLFTRLLDCDWQGLAAETATLTAGITAGRPMALPFQVLPVCADPAVLQQAAVCWTQQKFPDLQETVAPPPGRRLRVGYFSADFRTHPVAYLMAGLFERHDRERFETCGFYFGAGEDELTARIRNGLEHFFDIRELNDRDAVDLARSRQLDIAVDLGGHTQDSRNGLFAMRVAPVQVAYLGYPGTLGASYMDYLLADRTLVPAAHRQSYGEAIAYLPDSYLACDAAQALAAPPTREQAGLPAAGVVFCAFHNAYKLNPALFDCWLRILQAVAGSVLWLAVANPVAQANLRRAAAARGVAAARLVFAPRVDDMAGHLARLQLADLFLDAVPYNAHSSAADALWAGLPVLTCLGGSFAGRVAASLLYNVGLDELVTGDLDAYARLAVTLAQDAPRLEALRQRLVAARETAALFDQPRLCRQLESAYRTMQQRALAGLAPETFLVDG